jgi:D-alanyl-D-alanine carboxypeptidase/D-alanyl-D-alanine-endopeptidase (penicillin-binding protein 4)
VKHGVGTRERGLEELNAFLAEIGIDPRDHHFEDASGLSRQTLVTPAALSALLLHMYASPHREAWIETLPIGGEDGTLYNRFARTGPGSRIRAKTGSISHVSALSGYALRRNGRPYAFSILANNYNAPHAVIRKAMDALALALLQ